MNCPKCNAECEPTAVPSMVATDAKGRPQQQHRCECVCGHRWFFWVTYCPPCEMFDFLRGFGGNA